MDAHPSREATENKCTSDNNDKKNPTKRATVIRRQIDPNRLNNSGLSFQIAQILHQKKLEKAQQQQQQLDEQNATNMQKEQQQKPMTTSIVPITTKEADILSEQVEQKLSAFQSVPKILSVPKITITSPPSENSTETLRVNKCDRLEDVKRLLNRQILMRKLQNNATDVNTVPLSSCKQQPKTTVTLQLPPQTSIKSYRKSEVPISQTSVMTATSPVITVRKFHTLTSQSLLKKETTASTMATQQSSSSSSTGTTIRPVNITNSEGLTRNVVHQRTNIFPISISGTNSIQQPLSTTTKAIIRPVALSNADKQAIQTTTHPIQVQRSRQTVRSAATSQNSPEPSSVQRKVSLEKSSACSSNENPSTKTSNPRHKIVPTISTSKPKIFEIFSSKPSGQKEQQETTTTSPTVGNEDQSTNSTVVIISTKKSGSMHIPKTIESSSSKGVESLEKNVTHKKTLKRIVRSEPKQSSPKEEMKNTDITSPQTENIPIVLENKLLKPGEHIDLKGLGFACQNYDDTSPKDSTTQPDQSGKQKRKMHVIISNEKLKSAKEDIAALAKKVLLRASISSPGSIENSKVVSMESSIKSKISSSDGSDGTENSPTQSTESKIIKKQKPAILKASMSIVKKDLSQSPGQKTALRKKVLAFCGIKDDEQVSPVREYPKTVEIVDEEEATDDDTSAPTAVDFIASLSLPSCSFEEMEKANEQMKDTDCGDQGVKMQNNEAKIQKMESEKVPGESDNNRTVEETRKEIESKTQKIKSSDGVSLEVKSANRSGGEDLQRSEKATETLEKESIEYSDPKSLLDAISGQQDVSVASDITEMKTLEEDVVKKDNDRAIKSGDETKKDEFLQSPTTSKEISGDKQETTTEKHISGSSKSSTEPKGAAQKRTRFRKAQINLTARKKPAMTKTSQLSATEKIEIVSSTGHEVEDRIPENTTPESLEKSQSISVVNIEEKLQTDPKQEGVTLSPTKDDSVTDKLSSFPNVKESEEHIKDDTTVGPPENKESSNLSISEDLETSNLDLLGETEDKVDGRRESEKDSDPIVGTEKASQPEHSSTSNLIISLNLEANRDEVETVKEQHESTQQKELVQECKESDIKIIASVPIADESANFPDVVKGHSSLQASLPEVGTIIDMKAYGLEKTNEDIILQEVVLEDLKSTKNKEVNHNNSEQLPTESQEINSNSKENIQENPISKSINDIEDNDSDNDLSCAADNNDNSDTDNNVPITNRKRLCHKRPISSLLSTSGSEHETDEEETPSLSRSCRNSENSSTSDLFGFLAQSIGTTESQKPEYDDPNSGLAVEHNLDSQSSKSPGKDIETMFISPFVAVDTRRNVPLKKRWELSQQHSHDETDITDDTSPAADDDTMDDEGNDRKFLGMDENIPSVSPLNEVTIRKSSKKRRKSFPRGKDTISDVQKPMTKISEEKSITTDTSTIKAISSDTAVEVVSQQTTDTLDKDGKVDIVSSRKRGRKSKASITESNTGDSEEDTHHSLVQQSQLTDGSLQSLTNLPRKRGRPPKKVQRQEVSTSNNLDTTKTASNVSDIIVEPSTLKTKDLVGSERKRRGRKPRLEVSEKNIEGIKTHPLDEDLSKSNQSGQQQQENSIVETEVESMDPQPSIIMEGDVPMKKKRGRKPRMSIEVNRTTNPTSDIMEEPGPIAVSTPSNEVERKVQRKRGRKPRQQATEMDLSQETHSVSSEVETPLKKKRGRKPREIFNSSLIESPQLEGNTSLPRKRGRKSNTVIPNETEEAVMETSQPDATQSTNEIPNQMKSTPGHNTKKRVVNTGDFNPRLLLIRRREQLNTEEILTVPASETGEGPLQCGLCLGHAKPSNWASHLAEHYGVGWIVGKEPAIDVTTRSVVLSKMITYFKQHGTPLPCRLCRRSYRSSLGLLQHFESCGEVQSRVQCPTCKNDYTKLSYIHHQRTCQITKNEDDEKVSNTTDPVINSSGRCKRKSRMKAETKLKKLTKELSESGGTFEPKDFIQYRENQDGKGYYHCTVCPVEPGISFLDEAEAIGHVVEKHRKKRKAVEGFGSDGSDFDEKALGSGESEESEENTSDGDNSGAESFEEENRNKSRTSKKKSLVKKKSAPEVKRTGALPAVYSARSSDVPKLVLRKWKQFIGSNYSEETLFPFAMPDYGEEKGDHAKEMLSLEMDSMKFTFSQSAKLFEVVGKPKALEWQKLQRFQSVDQPRSEKLICLGAPIKTLAWVPVPGHITDQYLVVSCRKDLFTFTRVRNPKREESLLFVYKITTSPEDSQAKKKNFSASIHYALSVPNGPVHTLAFLPSGGFDPSQNRLGLLAIGTASSAIRIYALPIEPKQYNELRLEAIEEPVRVITLKPQLELILDDNDTLSSHSLVATQCLHICWSEYTGHQHIFASYVNGFIAFWDIKEHENSMYNLNCCIRNGIRYFFPINYFYFDEKAVKAFTIHYDTNGPRWLSAQGCARKLIIYDIHDMTNPMPIKEELLKNVPRDMSWSPIWETFAVAFCDTIPNNGRTIIAFNPAGVSFTHSKMEYMLCGVSSLHYNPWQNLYGIGVDNGDIIYINTREMNHDLNVLIRSKNNTIALSILDIKRLDGGELIRPKSSDNNENWNMYEKDYKDKYGLVFGQVNKFTAADRSAYLNVKRIPPRNLERLMRISVLRWNLNASGKRFIAIGYENGFLRITRIKRETYFN